MHRVDTEPTLTEELGIEFACDEHPVRIVVGQRSEQHGIDQREDGGVGADADGQRKDGDDRESRISADPANGVPKIVTQDLERGQSSLIPIAFFGGLHAAEPDPRAPVRLVGRQSTANVFVGQPLDVGLDLLGEIAVGMPAQKRADETRPAASDRAPHGLAPLSAMNRPTISVVWVHCASSAVSCFRPTLVMR